MSHDAEYRVKFISIKVSILLLQEHHKNKPSQLIARILFYIQHDAWIPAQQGHCVELF